MKSKLVYESNGIQLWLGNALHLDMLEDESVNLVVTSAPYNKGKMNLHKWKPEWYTDISDDLPREVYEQQQVDMLAELYRVSKSGATLAYVHKPQTRDNLMKHPMQWLIRSEWTPIQEIVWERQGTQQMDDGRFWDPTERIYWFAKGVPKYFNPTCAKLGTVWRINFKVNEVVNHPAPFPIALAYRCIEAFSKEDDLILDPYVGSGTTMVATQMLKRRGIGVDISKQYLADAKERLMQRTAF